MSESVCGHSRVAVCGRVWPCVWPCVAVCGHAWPCVAVMIVDLDEGKRTSLALVPIYMLIYCLVHGVPRALRRTVIESRNENDEGTPKAGIGKKVGWCPKSPSVETGSRLYERSELLTHRHTSESLRFPSRLREPFYSGPATATLTSGK